MTQNLGAVILSLNATIEALETTLHQKFTVHNDRVAALRQEIQTLRDTFVTRTKAIQDLAGGLDDVAVRIKRLVGE